MVLGPGLLLSALVTVGAFGIEDIECRMFGRPWLEALVLAILLGTVVRSVWTPGACFQAGIDFSAKILLEIAVMLLGAAVSFRALAGIGPGLLFGIAGTVILAITASFGLCRILGLPHRLALLVACGNAICGNSAIAAVAPVIGADSDDVASSIAFTAVLGVLVVLSLPLLLPVLGFSVTQFGVFAGLTVYAVPQVLAATTPVGAMAVQIGTLVKLVRVLMLGPVVLALSIAARAVHTDAEPPGSIARKSIPIYAIVPWFIVAFLGLAALHTLGLMPAVALAPAAGAARLLTVVSMAALGLGVDIRVVARAGGRVTGAVVTSLLLLGFISLGLIRMLGLA
ncbi:YeiH family protein [Lichenifustis flavocetrariae]|uniref:Sulfate exporter family transporter n=1 Tax=Lichenifustis flavocetrariae TaxID=2949735 RepID=A0AA41YZJ2_9HYPH|nr:putative sulfate exporter family transporter [Lichenifustis flavocetrariae]MCW6507720.1 putative sulfate exporter family transporter [Lichenifustis flavocetrariae]